MFKNLTIGKKLLLGFGFALSMLAIIVVFSFVGVSGIVRDASEVIYGSGIDAIMAQTEVDHLNWTGNVNKLLSDESVTSLSVETDDHKCGFGKWLYGDDRKEAEKRVPELASILKDIETPHLHLHNSAIEMQEVFAQPHGDLGIQLANRLNEHISWVNKVNESLAGELGGLYSYQSLTRNAVEQALSVLKACDEDESLGDKSARMEMAKKMIKGIRYGKSGDDYLWINDTEPKMIMHPIKPQLDGQDLSGSADPKGKKIFVEMANVCKKDGEGFVTYQWPLPGTNENCPKISYVKLYEPWGWIVGTGVFIDNSNKGLVERAEQFANHESFHLGVQTDPTKCAFGIFLDAPETATLCNEFPVLKSALNKCRGPHKKLHESAIIIEELVTQVKTGDAVKVYQSETSVALSSVKVNLHDAINAESDIARGFNKASEVYSKQTVPNLEEVQELLNDLRKTVKSNVMTNDVMLSNASSLKTFVTIIGVLSILVGVASAFLIARGIITALTHIIDALSEGSDQVASAATQVSSASQSLAEGATEQAAGLEETSSSLEEMSSMTRQNADNAQQANALAASASKAANSGNEKMTKMNEAIQDIQKSSDATAKIIKVIDEIAFQTNLLALNAAVEAARAGEAGKGFAVVAEEVRNLAMRSAEAAKDTSAMIEASVKNASNGVEIATEVGKVLEEIVSGINKTTGLVGEIAAASQEQSQGIDQVNTAVSQMDKVTQANAANAEESASASEELSAQAEQMNSIVEELSALVGGVAHGNASGHSSTTLSTSDHAFHQIASGANRKVTTRGDSNGNNSFNGFND